MQGPDSPFPRLMEALAIPPAPGYRTLGARVEHVLAPRDGRLSELVTESLQLPQARGSDGLACCGPQHPHGKPFAVPV